MEIKTHPGIKGKVNSDKVIANVKQYLLPKLIVKNEGYKKSI